MYVAWALLGNAMRQPKVCMEDTHDQGQRLDVAILWLSLSYVCMHKESVKLGDRTLHVRALLNSSPRD